MNPNSKSINDILSAVSALPKNLFTSLFSGKNNQTDEKPGKKIHSGKWTLEEIKEQRNEIRKKSEINKFFGTGVGLEKADLEKFRLVSELFQKTQSGDNSKLSLIDFIKNSRSGEGSLTGNNRMFANILTDPNISKEQLPGLFQAYDEFIKNPSHKDPLPKYRVSQQNLSAFGKENVPIIKDFLKQMYPEEDYTSIEDILGRIKLGDKPGGLTLDIGSLMSPDYYGGNGRGGWHSQSSFFEEPESEKYGSINPVKEIISSFGEKSKYSSSVPSSSASINIGSWLGTAKQPNITGEKADDIRRTLIHEFGHVNPQFVAKRGNREESNPSSHQTPFDEMLNKALGSVKGMSEASTAIKKEYMQSLEYQQTMNHPMSKFVQMLVNEGIDPFSIYGKHIVPQTQN